MSNKIIGRKFTYVKDLFIDGCDAPLSAWFEASGPALLAASLSYYCIDPIEVFTGWVRPAGRPKGARQGRHSRGNHAARKGSKLSKGISRVWGFDPNDWLAKKMPFQEELEGRRTTNGVNWMWSAFGEIQKFQNAMFLYATVEDFFYNTAIGVARTEYCQNQRASSFMARNTRDGHFAPLGKTPVGPGEVLKQRFCHYAGGNVVGPEAKNYHAMISCSRFTTWSGEPITPGPGYQITFGSQPPVGSEPLESGAGGMASGTSRDGGACAFFLTGPFNFWAHDQEIMVFGRRGEPSIRPEGWCNELFNNAVNWAERA